jgi:hypothetical protein
MSAVFSTSIKEMIISTPDSPLKFFKSGGIKIDVLTSFFGDGMHAVFFGGEHSIVMPFIDRLGLIWISTHIGWIPVDKNEFDNFTTNDDCVELKACDHKTTISKMSIPT